MIESIEQKVEEEIRAESEQMDAFVEASAPPPNPVMSDATVPPLEYLPANYVRDDPMYGAASPQSIYRFENDLGATVTRHQGLFHLDSVRFTGAEITNFRSLEIPMTASSEEVVQAVLHGIKNT